MKKSTFIVSFAGISLMAALYAASLTFLQPEQVKAPPPPIVAEISETTHYSFGDQTLKAEVVFDRLLWSPPHATEHQGSNPSFWTSVDVEAIANPSPVATISTVLVIDRSGSMTGEKMERAKQAAFRLIKQLGSNDQLAIVSYGTTGRVDFPVTNMTPEGQKRALKAMETMDAAGGTNIEHALQLTLKLAQSGHPASDRAQVSPHMAGPPVGRVLFLSDGRPTEGNRNWQILRNLGTQLRSNGYRVSTIGIGDDYNEDLLQKIASAADGRYHHIKNAVSLGKIFHDEMRHARRTVARAVSLRLPRQALANGQVYRLKNVLGHTWTPCEENIYANVSLGDLASSEKRVILAEYHLADQETQCPSLAQCQRLNAFSLPELKYTHPAEGQRQLRHPHKSVSIPQTTSQRDAERSVNPTIALQVASFNASESVKRSMDLLKNGEKTPAIRLLKNQTDKINRLLTTDSNLTPQQKDVAEGRALINRIIDDLNQSTTREHTPPPHYIKAQKARAYQRQHRSSN